METLPGVDAKREMTERLVKWIGKRCVRETFALVAEDTGLDEKTIRNVFDEYFEQVFAQFKIEVPKWIGIDEIHLTTNRCVITNLDDNSLLEILPSRDKKTVIAFLKDLPNKERIQYVAMDMWRPYRDAVTEVFPAAKIVIDKFHVVKMANDAMETVRKNLRSKQSRENRKGLMHDRFVLLKRADRLNQEGKTKLEAWINTNPILGIAHKLKEEFFTIYDAKSPEEAAERFEAWRVRAVSPKLDGAFTELIRAWTNWEHWILNYFVHPVTNAYTECLNSLIRVVDRTGRGYSFKILRAKLLMSHGATKLTSPKFQRLLASETERSNDADMIEINDLCDQGLDRWMGDIHGIYEGLTEPIPFKGADIPTLIRLLEAGILLPPKHT
jgi:transposase